MELELALKKHFDGDLIQAEALYLSILEKAPNQPDALHYLGILMHQRGASDKALQLVVKSLQLAPGRADWHNDLGNILFERREVFSAAEAFLDSIELGPENANAWNNLGSALEKLHRYDDAETAYGKAIAFDPAFVDALNNMGNLLAFCGREVEAAEYHCRAYVVEPTADKPKSMLGIAYYKLGRISDAAEVYRQWMMDEPDNPVACHLHAACSKIDVPARASNAYIERTFDAFSENFDTRLEELSYRGPQLIRDALHLAIQADGGLAVLDGGCGTGLCGPLIRPYASRLVGVDLSSGMLEVARQSVYDELVKMELTEYLSSQRETFDVIVASDTFIYFGDLTDVIRAARGALKAGGLLLFTTEEADESACHVINPHGRYSHGRVYLDSVLRDEGFEVSAIESHMMRFEFGKPVKTLVVTSRKF